MADETTPPHFPEAMVIGKAVFHLISCNFENPVATVKKKLIGTYYPVTATEIYNLPVLLQDGLGIPGGEEQFFRFTFLTYTLSTRDDI